MHPGVLYALCAALLFGLSTPLAKRLTDDMGPVALAALLYLGAGGGLLLWRGVRRGTGAALRRRDLPWLAGAIAAGGICAPVLLMWGLQRLPGAQAALLLNLEAVFTALLAWFVFHENFDRRIVAGMACILAGGAALAWTGEAPGNVAGSLAITAACLLWAVDNNLTRRVATADPLLIAGWKGIVAGAVNGGIALSLGASLPSVGGVAGAVVVGFVGYGLSLVLFVSALGRLGAARTGAYFALAPFVGAAASLVLLHERPSLGFGIGLGFMLVGVGLHASERHIHQHRHEALEHEHAHVHDEHHRHDHDFAWDGVEPHAHPHRHAPLIHSHPHYPDLHHRHRH